MAKLQIIYDVSDDSEEIIKIVEDHVNLKTDEAAIFEILQRKMQLAFDEGRKFQQQLSIQSGNKDSILHKAEI